MFTAIAIALITLGWAVGENKRANKLKDQRDNLIALLDAEGRGKEAVKAMS